MPCGKKLTSRQRVINYIRHFWATYGYPPTLTEIARSLGFNSGETVRYHMKALRAAGLVEWQEGPQRTIRLKEMNQ